MVGGCNPDRRGGTSASPPQERFWLAVENLRRGDYNTYLLLLILINSVYELGDRPNSKEEREMLIWLDAARGSKQLHVVRHGILFAFYVLIAHRNAAPIFCQLQDGRFASLAPLLTDDLLCNPWRRSALIKVLVHGRLSSLATKHVVATLKALDEEEVLAGVDITKLYEAAVESSNEQMAKENAERKAKQEAKQKAKQKAEQKAEQEAKQKAEQEAKQKAEQEAKQKAEQEAKQKAEQEAKQKAEQEAKQKAEQEAKQKAEQEAKQKAEQEAKQKAEQEAKQKAEQEAMQKAEQEEKQKAEQEAMQKATPPQPRRGPARSAREQQLPPNIGSSSSFTRKRRVNNSGSGRGRGSDNELSSPSKRGKPANSSRQPSNSTTAPSSKPANSSAPSSSSSSDAGGYIGHVRDYLFAPKEDVAALLNFCFDYSTTVLLTSSSCDRAKQIRRDSRTTEASLWGMYENEMSDWPQSRAVQPLPGAYRTPPAGNPRWLCDVLIVKGDDRRACDMVRRIVCHDTFGQLLMDTQADAAGVYR